MSDKSCLISFTLFLLSGLLNFLVFRIEAAEYRSGAFNYQLYKTLDPEFIKSRWTFRELNYALGSSARLLNAFAWFSLVVPICKVAVVLSKRGKRFPIIHGYLVVLVFAGGYGELVSRLVVSGLEDSIRWIVMKFNLDDWRTAYNGEVDGMGWRVVEMADIVTRGFVFWIDSMEWLVLFQIAFIVHFSILNEEKDKKLLSPKVGYFGLVMGVLCIADFVTSILRLYDWRTFNFITFVISILNRVIAIPLWLYILGRQLPDAVRKFESEGAPESTAPQSN